MPKRNTKGQFLPATTAAISRFRFDFIIIALIALAAVVVVSYAAEGCLDPNRHCHNPIVAIGGHK